MIFYWSIFRLTLQFNGIVLISRTAEKLKQVADEICQKFPNTQVKTIPFDFTNADVNEYESKIFPVLDEIDVGILVNNVGMSYEYPG